MIIHGRAACSCFALRYQVPCYRYTRWFDSAGVNGICGIDLVVIAIDQYPAAGVIIRCFNAFLPAYALFYVMHDLVRHGLFEVGAGHLQGSGG